MRSTILPRRVTQVSSRSDLAFATVVTAPLGPVKPPAWVVVVVDGPVNPPCPAASTGMETKAIIAVIAAIFFILYSPFCVGMAPITPDKT